MNGMSNSMRSLPEVESAPPPRPAHRLIAFLSLGVAVLLLICFAWIADSVRDFEIQNFDWTVRNWVHQFASPPLTRVMIFMSFLGKGGLIVAAVVAILLFLKLRWRRAALWVVVTLAGATVLDLALKYSFHRARPTPFFGALPHTYSFPSGHSLFSFCFYGVLAGLITARVQSRPARIVIWFSSALLVAAIGVSRIYLGVHYPSDVIAGYLAAAMWVSAMIALDRSWKHRGSSRS